VSNQHALLRRIVEAAEIDTVVDSRLVVDSAQTTARQAHENNVIGTMNILAACSHSTVRNFVFKSSAHYYGTAQDDPAFFTESMGRPHPPGTPIEKDVVEAEASVRDFAEKNPHVRTTILRMCNVLGPQVRTSHTQLFSLPVIPMLLGFDPRYQFVHEEDVVAAAAHAVNDDLAGVYNVAGDGVLALTEVASLLGKRWAPVLSPWGTGVQAAMLRRAGMRIPAEVLGQLRFGRGLDNRKLKATGFRYRYTSREAVLALAEHLRLHPVMRGTKETYKYEREVEDFLRWSPHVRGSGYRGQHELTTQERIELRRLGSPTTGSPRQQAAVMARTARAGDRPAVEPTPAEQANGGDPSETTEGPPAAGRPPESADPPDPAARVPDHLAPGASGDASRPAVEHYDDLDAGEIVALLDSLETADLQALREYELGASARPRILAGIDGALARRAASRSAPRPS
jgi:UDP-glucose 4-epimerase